MIDLTLWPLAIKHGSGKSLINRRFHKSTTINYPKKTDHFPAMFDDRKGVLRSLVTVTPGVFIQFQRLTKTQEAAALGEDIGELDTGLIDDPGLVWGMEPVERC